MEFKNRLKQLREEKGMIQKELAEKIGVTRNSITAYENGNREPDLEKIINLAKIFDVSIDYLVGVSDIKKRDSHFFVAVEKLKNISLKELLEIIEIVKKLQN
jgi:transcriptional regulator with XRE-family HTH domain